MKKSSIIKRKERQSAFESQSDYRDEGDMVMNDKESRDTDSGRLCVRV